MHEALALLNNLRDHTGPAESPGLSHERLRPFLESDPRLVQAIAEAARVHAQLRLSDPDLLALPEREAIERLQSGFVNFYASDAVNPYIAIAARGPWIVTLHGAVIHDNGGYGMLGFGHGPQEVLEALHTPWVMANIMTPSVSQLRFDKAIRAELGHAREGGCPFDRFICMNSGSESVAVAARIADLLANENLAEGGRHAGKRPVYLGIERAFHGRTDRPARFSDSTRPTFNRLLASFRAEDDEHWTVPANDIASLEQAFARADRENRYIELLAMEPVQGEGSPGKAMTRAFYDAARRLTREYGTLFLVDSIQAGLRTWGTLSIVDYPGFEDCDPPDMETWSKALNAGQYPMSVLGLTERAADLYKVGVYGNTMTTAPRALEAAVATLGMLDADVRTNIREQGCNFVGDLQALQARFPEMITSVVGTGLLFCCELDPSRASSIGPGSAEERCRQRGLGVIHGGRNALRFTPHFRVTDAERALVADVLAEVFAEIQAEQRTAAK